jgi:hypothetical protein
MKKIILFAALLVSAAPVAAATSSADLEAIAKTLEQSGPSATLNTQLLSLLREPAKTLDGVTLPSTAAQYTTTIDTALKLRPKGWIAGGSEQYPVAASGVNCTAAFILVGDGRTAGTAHGSIRLGKGELCLCNIGRDCSGMGLETEASRTVIHPSIT